MKLALNNIRSLHNVGAIFRSADATGVEEIILGGLTPTPPRAEIEKTALGATKTVPWSYQPNLLQYLTDQKQQGTKVYVLEITPYSHSLFNATLSDASILVVGNEVEGVEASILEIADIHLHIPMFGKSAQSLNLSNATTVALYAFRTGKQ